MWRWNDKALCVPKNCLKMKEFLKKNINIDNKKNTWVRQVCVPCAQSLHVRRHAYFLWNCVLAAASRTGRSCKRDVKFQCAFPDLIKVWWWCVFKRFKTSECLPSVNAFSRVLVFICAQRSVSVCMCISINDLESSSSSSIHLLLLHKI